MTAATKNRPTAVGRNSGRTAAAQERTLVYRLCYFPEMSSNNRQLRSEEQALIAHLWGMTAVHNVLPAEVLVRDMDDGGMGSLSFVSGKPSRSFGKIAGSCSFIDRDGVQVLATLLLDQEGDLFELDIWKTSFEPLIQIPNASFFSPVGEQPSSS